MSWFRKKDKKENGDDCLIHEWVITERLLLTYQNDDIPESLRAIKHETRVSRICRLCFKKEMHYVTGHIDYDKALKIFGGK